MISKAAYRHHSPLLETSKNSISRKDPLPLRAINYEIDQLKTPPDEYLAPNSLNRDYTDDDSDDVRMVTESAEEGSEI